MQLPPLSPRSGPLVESGNQIVASDCRAASARREGGAEKAHRLTTMSNASSVVTELAKNLKSKRIESFVNKLKHKDFGKHGTAVKMIATDESPLLGYPSQNLAVSTQYDGEKTGFVMIKESANFEATDPNDRQGADLVNNEFPTNIFETSNTGSQFEDRRASLVHQEKFDDTLDHFIEIVKKITKAYAINIYSKELIQIFKDASSDAPQIISNDKTLTDFLMEVKAAKESNCFKHIKMSELEIKPNKHYNYQRDDVLLLKFRFEGGAQDGDDQLVLLEVFYEGEHSNVDPETILRICDNFFQADDELRREILLLLQISESLSQR